ncbi:hypothetical protein SAMN05428978_10209 [Nitrosomonas sp. Nm34]|nr:hypothetical protein SAMN05428978_10209 [Nitrosomonas sp. Nm34]
MAQAYLSGHYTLTQVGEYFGMSYAVMSRAVKQAEKKKAGMSNVIRYDPKIFGCLYRLIAH